MVKLAWLVNRVRNSTIIIAVFEVTISVGRVNQAKDL